ncbi:cadmium-translocating P-type ATPase [Bacillaceae bacterium Marseille-Q3522]|nr:cadmium-translocating P-type ATPase [Bacillaceae bacterium Marseille-Q3522]
MEVESKAQVLSNSKEESSIRFFEKLSPYMEIIAAVICGLLILTGWLLSKFDASSLSIAAYVLSFVIGGYAKAKEGIEKTIEEKKLNVEMLMLLAAIGSSIIGYWSEGAILIFIFAMSGALETYTMNRSHKEISSLMSLQPEEAIVIENGEEKRVPVSQLRIGDIMLVKPGERVPSDGNILTGRTSLDEAAITGESIPVTKEIGDEIFAGTVNVTGSITVEITKKTTDTLFQKIIELVQSAKSEKSPSQLFIEHFEGMYVNIVLIVVGFMMFLPHFLLGWGWMETFYRAMILLVVASPCALVASIMPATLSAISNGARQGILFKGGVHLENLSYIKAIAFDKTGTLTKGKPQVTDIVCNNRQEEATILLLTASIENHSTHPLAQAIVQHVKTKLDAGLLQLDGVENNSGLGVKAVVNGDEWKIGNADFVGKTNALSFENGISIKLANEGKTIAYVAKNGEIAAVIALKDIVRSETKDAIQNLTEKGIYTVMLTGDSQITAKAIASESNVSDYIAECLPAYKADHIKELKEKYGNVAMVGDGINDAPALATADVGIAMGEGTDVALETADIVLMKNNLPRISEAITLSKRMNRIIKQNVVFSISVIALLICTNFLQFLDLPYGVIGHEGSTILVILNSLRLLR